tara:strand:- start:416 stop:772 length:357 start_codon:yes stop_codon:yes gene_type:complete
MITYDWNCRTVDARPLENGETNVVYDVHWIVIGTSDEVDAEGNAYLATVIGVQNLPWNPEGTFIPFEDLTNEMVVEWTQAAMGEEQVASIEANIQSQINALITPTSVTLLIGAEMLDE